MLRIAVVLLALGIIGWSAAAGAHGKATERYIPIGQSPDSGRYTVLGTLTAIEPAARAVHIDRDGAALTVSVTDATGIWLDRSKLKVTNLTLRLDQLTPGRRVEVRCGGNRCGTHIVAEWIKVEGAAGDMASR